MTADVGLVERLARIERLAAWYESGPRHPREFEEGRQRIAEDLRAIIASLATTREDTLREAAALAYKWRDENKAACTKAGKSISEGARNMADMLDGAAIECNAIGQAIEALIPKE